MHITFPSLRTFATSLTRTIGLAALGTVLVMQAPVQASANEKYAAFVIDANNGNVLFNRYGDERRYPASLTKMMTLYMLFEAMKSGRISEGTLIKVSSYAAGRPPSKLGLKAGSTITVEEAIYALVTKSANDVATVVAEFLGGSETRFAEMMTTKARQLGMSRTTFRNPHGLPDSGQVTTARDMATLGMALREHFPDQYEYFSARSFNFRGRTVRGHNRVLDRVKGADGIKTGYIRASGFNLVSSVVRGDKKLVAVVMGGRSGRTRDDHMVELLEKYLPQASTRDAGALVAAHQPLRQGPLALPQEVPTPQFLVRATPAAPDATAVASVADPAAAAMTTSIDERIALAYGSQAGGAVAAMPVPDNRPIIGRDALRAALFSETPRSPMIQLPAASRTPGAPIPPAAIPDGYDLDPATTGSVARAAPAAAPSSPWVVQIAAVPSESGAMEMLSEAKRKTGGPLSDARPFTETVESGSETLHRARFAGFETKDEAWRACEALKRSSYACYAVAN